MSEEQKKCDYHGCGKEIKGNPYIKTIRVNRKPFRGRYCDGNCAIRAQMSAEG